MKKYDYSNYVKNKRSKRRMYFIAELGGKCVICGSKKQLEFDHIIKKTKKFTIAAQLTSSLARIKNEIKKCQLLCKECHKEKTAQERMAKHGTLSRYDHRKFPCRCQLCKRAHKIYHINYKKKKLKELGEV